MANINLRPLRDPYTYQWEEETEQLLQALANEGIWMTGCKPAHRLANKGITLSDILSSNSMHIKLEADVDFVNRLLRLGKERPQLSGEGLLEATSYAARQEFDSLAEEFKHLMEEHRAYMTRDWPLQIAVLYDNAIDSKSARSSLLFGIRFYKTMDCVAKIFDADLPEGSTEYVSPEPSQSPKSKSPSVQEFRQVLSTNPEGTSTVPINQIAKSGASAGRRRSSKSRKGKSTTPINKIAKSGTSAGRRRSTRIAEQPKSGWK